MMKKEIRGKNQQLMEMRSWKSRPNPDPASFHLVVQSGEQSVEERVEEVEEREGRSVLLAVGRSALAVGRSALAVGRSVLAVGRLVKQTATVTGMYHSHEYGFSFETICLKGTKMPRRILTKSYTGPTKKMYTGTQYRI